jgi:DNA-binding IclR family transcriptional regulator
MIKSRARRRIADGSEDGPSPVARVFSVIELTAAAGSISVSQIVEALGIPRPSAHRIVSTLEAMRFLQNLPGRGKYGPAPRLIELAADIMSSTVVYAPLQLTLAELARKLGETCSLAMVSGGEVEYIASAFGNSALTLQFEAGQRTPIHCTSSGRIFLANIPEERLEKFLATGPWQAITPHTIIDPRAMRRELELIRRQDYALNDSEFIVGVVGAAVPVRSNDDKVLAALSVSAPKIRVSLERLKEFIPALRSAAVRIAQSI